MFEKRILPIFRQGEIAGKSLFASVLPIHCVLNRTENVASKQFQLRDIVMGRFTNAGRLAPCYPALKKTRQIIIFPTPSKSAGIWPLHSKVHCSSQSHAMHSVHFTMSETITSFWQLHRAYNTTLSIHLFRTNIFERYKKAPSHCRIYHYYDFEQLF